MYIIILYINKFLINIIFIIFFRWFFFILSVYLFLLIFSLFDKFIFTLALQHFGKNYEFIISNLSVYEIKTYDLIQNFLLLQYNNIPSDLYINLQKN
jgi:hypothetical protein